MSLALPIFIACVCFLLVLRRVFRREPLADIRGPPTESFWLGNQHSERHQDQAGDVDFHSIEEYGSVWRSKDPFNEDRLCVADPKALQHILHKSGYIYPKRIDATQMSRLITGEGLVWAAGDVHSRQRKAMNPAFSASQLRSLLPIFQKTTLRLCQKLEEEIQDGKETINVAPWLARTTLDVIGEASLGYRFGALDKEDSPFVKAFSNLFIDSVLDPPKWDIIFKSTWKYIPERLLQAVAYIPTREYTRFRRFVTLAKRTAAELIREKSGDILSSGSTSKDVLSICVRSNMAEEAKHKMAEDEILSQMATIMLAGHETTASTMNWLLYELTRHPDHQRRLRQEIRAAREELESRGEEELTSSLLDSLPILNAVIKETLRLHPIVPNLIRVAGKDDVIPLSLPVKTISGRTVSEVPIRKGQSVMISICGYQRLRSVWGDDAHEWNPDRWADMKNKDQVNVGVLSNLLVFSAGLRACIGWRFALLELQAMAFELVSHFEFSPAPEKYEIRRVPAGLMMPMIRGKMEMGVQMPLKVTRLEKT